MGRTFGCHVPDCNRITVGKNYQIRHRSCTIRRGAPNGTISGETENAGGTFFENQKITVKKNKKNPLVLILLAALLVN